MVSIKKYKPKERDLIKALFAGFANQGLIDLSRPEAEILDQFTAAVEGIDCELEPIIVIDHTKDLLSRARQAQKSNDLSISVLMYATWVEHMLNMILIELATNKSLNRSQTNAMIKEASLRAKSTWLLSVLGGKQLSPVSIGRIQRLADARNAYIHYKWGQTGSAARSDQNLALVDAEKLVKTLQQYKSREIAQLSSRSKVIRKLLTV